MNNPQKKDEDLKSYREKRHFSRTPEPMGGSPSGSSARRYLIQKHAARSLHYDFRLELNGVLKSWAVPKGPSLDPSERHLAVHVEDHPIEYGDFEGVIPEGEYGGGAVMLWDRGQWEPLGDPEKSYRQGKLKFRLSGEKLTGGWTLVRMGRKNEPDNKNWLLIKERDAVAVDKNGQAILEKLDKSVLTGRSMSEIAKERDRIWSGEEGEIKREETGVVSKEVIANQPVDLKKLPGAAKSPASDAYRPMMPTLVDKPATGPGWIHEIKYDGYRILTLINNERITFLSRSGQDWTDRFPDIAGVLTAWSLPDTILDGEMVILKDDLTTDFQALQNYLQGRPSGRLVYYVFDLLRHDGYDLCRVPLLTRKKILENLVQKNTGSDSSIRYGGHIIGEARDVIDQACRFALEGIVSKRKDSRYEQRRSRFWLKTKCLHQQEFVIVGFTEPSGSRTGFGALLLGYYDDHDKLVYAGRVGTGFNESTLADITARLEKLRRDKSPLSHPLSSTPRRHVHWVEPQLIAQVEFGEWTREGLLRIPSFKGLREDKPSDKITRELPLSIPAESDDNDAAQQEMSMADQSPKPLNTKVRLTHPEKILYPEINLTKGALAAFYEQIGDWILPHLVDRPLTLVRCPQGRTHDCFYQKHLNDSVPKSVHGVTIRIKGREELYLTIDDLDGLLGLVQIDALEIHPWGSRRDRLERPDRMIFDLDPDPGVSWDNIVSAARLLKLILEDIGLQSFLKTTGGKGFHLVIPLTRRSDWTEIKDFSRSVVEHLVEIAPDRFTANMKKDKRLGKIFIDYLRNAREATAVAPYSVRARKGAPVSTPVAWDELTPELKPDAFGVLNLPARLSSLKSDPWEGFFVIRQSITKAMKNELGIKR